ncbi:MAG: gliding motility protein GldL [Flavobacteriaceae bacterium]|jgi:hypothetical protein|nr:gliding motility protein GldL [Flavobacteriaceae bacterium]
MALAAFKTKAARLNFVYSFGASIVILGALLKLTHWHWWIFTGNTTLAAGLVTEAIIFLVFAFDAPKTEESYAWENVYPELLDKDAKPNPRHSTISGISAEIAEAETSLSDKLDKMLADAKLDVGLFERLKGGIDKFSDTVNQINQTADVSASANRYSEQLNKATQHMESMNALYALQLEDGRIQSEASKRYIEDLQRSSAESTNFNNELEGLTSNLNNLNRVYGGMLNAMKS